eukprot:TRINITY_DN929_c0_g1_i3.p1 TRINITY_DN929_c0_g1~~TRINITY_DN929_c0_g1_i3.p1  ORF type:complete len:1482 (+),score=423.93 TRINITY_DN929_c0_g1_i3:96-4541(+)
MTSAKFNELYTWGTASTKGKLGHTESGRRPVLLKQLKGLGPLFIAVGESHSAVIVDSGKDVYQWGSNERGQLGRGDTESQPVPRLVISLRDRRICRIACGAEHTLALSATGIVYAYGSNSRGQLGLGTTAPKYLCDPEVVKGPWEATGAGVARVSCGAFISAAVTDTGKVYIWGDGYDGLLGNGDTSNDMHSPLLLAAMQRHAMADVQFGARHALALTANGEVFSWGANRNGELGLGVDAPERVNLPTEIILPFKGKRIVQIACGTSHSACLVANGDVFSFGLGASGQIGVGTRNNQWTPMKVIFPSSIRGDKVSLVSCGSSWSMALTERGRVYSWGAGTRNQLGHGDRKDVLCPRWIECLQSAMVQQLACGGDSAAVLTGRIGSNPMDVFKGIGRQTVTQTQTINVFIGTYNINSQKQCFSARSLQTWLMNEGGATGFPGNEPPHIYAIGIQELVNLSSSAVAKDIVEIEGSEMKSLCEHQIEATINVNGLHYVLLCSRQLVGAMLCLFVLKDLESQITRLEWDTVRVGVMGKMGNKGAVAIRFGLYDSQFCFIDSHFAAGPGKVEKRNKDYKDTSSRLRFPASDGRELTVFDHENIFWFGDFNYRLNDISKDQVKLLIQQERYEELYPHDQLNIERQAERVFLGFKEGKINFAPSYKYDPFTTQYDTSEKNRTPAWCDRVLWKGENITLLDYRRHELLTSDHRPVSALFVCTIKRKQESVATAPPVSISLRPKATSVFNMNAPAEFADYPERFPSRPPEIVDSDPRQSWSSTTSASLLSTSAGSPSGWTGMRDWPDHQSEATDLSAEISDSDSTPGDQDPTALDGRSDYSYVSPGSSPSEDRGGSFRERRMRARTFDPHALAAAVAEMSAPAVGKSGFSRISAPVESLTSDNWLQSYPEAPRTPSSLVPMSSSPAAPSSRQSAPPPAFLPDYPNATRINGSGGSATPPVDIRAGDSGHVRSPHGRSLSSFSPPVYPAFGPPDLGSSPRTRLRSARPNSPTRPQHLQQPTLPDRSTKPKPGFSPLDLRLSGSGQPLVGAHGLSVAGIAEAPFANAAARRPRSPLSRTPTPPMGIPGASIAVQPPQPPASDALTDAPTPPPQTVPTVELNTPVASEEQPLFARVMYDYEAENDEELSLRSGELLTIIAIDPSGWWKAERDGIQGWVPKPFLELSSPPNGAAAPTGPPDGVPAPVAPAATGLPDGVRASVAPVDAPAGPTPAGTVGSPAPGASALGPPAAALSSSSGDIARSATDDDFETPPTSAPPSRVGSFSGEHPNRSPQRNSSSRSSLADDPPGDFEMRRRPSQADVPVDLPDLDDDEPGSRSAVPARTSKGSVSFSRRDRSDSEKSRDRLTELSDVATSAFDGVDLNSPPLKQGFLSKRGHVRKNWKSRLFVLRADSLAYYENQHTRQPKGVIELRDVTSMVKEPASLDRRGNNRLLFRLLGRKDHAIACQTAEEFDAWTGAIERAIADLKWVSRSI